MVGISDALSDELATNRRAARYAPVGAEYHVGQRALTILTVSMSGLSLRWSGATLPAIGTVVDGDIFPDPSSQASGFAALVQIARLDPRRQLAAGRFVKLSGGAMDRLLNWLVRLDRIETATSSPE